jgi:hypothetical protein
VLAWIVVLITVDTTSAQLRREDTVITTGGSLNFSTTLQEVLEPTTVHCRSRRPCTLRLELSSQFSNVPVGSVAAVRLLMDDSPEGIEPANPAGLDSTSNSGASNVRTFSWVKRDVDRGSHTIRVFFFVSPSGTAGSFSRILTVDVFRGDNE